MVHAGRSRPSATCWLLACAMATLLFCSAVEAAESLDEMKLQLITAEDTWNNFAKMPSNAGKMESLYTLGATLIPIDTNAPAVGSTAIAAYFKLQKTAIQARFARAATIKCYNETLCTRHGQMTFTYGAGTTSATRITDARQLVVYTRAVEVAAAPAKPGAGKDSDSDDSDSSDSDRRRSLQQVKSATRYGRWMIAEMHQSAPNPFTLPKPATAIGKA